MFKLRDLEFSIKKAIIKGTIESGFLNCFIEVDMNSIVKDGENWPPRLCHQGLKIKANSWEELPGTKIEYESAYVGKYDHPEIGMLYVFGHEETRKNIIEFGPIENGEICFKWEGVNNVWWDKEYGDDVPFKLDCKLEIYNA